MTKTVSFVEKYTPWLLEATDPVEERAKQEYQKFYQQSRDEDPAIRCDVAASEFSPSEILHNLARDDDVRVRRAVAGNKATPPKTNILLARDEDEDVRLILARRLAKLMPDLSEAEQAELYRSTVKVLHVLAQDKVAQIRVALTTSLKDVTNAPPELIKKLAEDVEKEVADPILRFSVLLSDEDLMAIIAMNPMGWRVSSISQREKVSKKVATVVIKTGNEEAGLALMDNDGAHIPNATLKKILKENEFMPSWKAAASKRKKMPSRVSQKLNDMLGGVLGDFLSFRSPIEKEERARVLNTMERRVKWAEENEKDESSAMRVKRLVAEGRLSESDIADALSWKDEDFVVTAIAYLARVSPMVVRRMLDAKSAKATVAICKRANLSAGFAASVQERLIGLPSTKVIMPKEDGNYAMSDDDMIWQLEFFGIE